MKAQSGSIQNVAARLVNVDPAVNAGDAAIAEQATQTFKAGIAQVLAKEIVTSATISGGQVVFDLTDSNSNAILSSVFTESIRLEVWDSSNQYVYGTPVVSGDNKSLTIPVNKLGTVIAGIVQFIAAANGVTVNLSVKGI